MSTRLQLDRRQLAALCALGTRRQYQGGSLLFREGDHSDHVIVLLSGTVKIVSTASSGYETVLALRSAGEIVGEFAVFDRRPRSASVLALHTVDGVRIAGDGFRSYLHSDPDLTLALLTGVVHRLRESDRRRVEFGAYDVTSRVARLLLELAEQAGDPRSLSSVALTQQELAGAVGASREAVARSLRLLRARRAITTHRMRITIVRPELLRDRGDGHSPAASAPTDRELSAGD
jgi:CRP-like cAMP-binding protein